MQNKNIVILGGGFAGLRTALKLNKKLAAHGFKITLIDERDTHIYTPDLYEIATAFNEKITQECLVKLADTVAIPFTKILAGTGINFLRDKVLLINPAAKKVSLKRAGELDFDYLVCALGSSVNYYDIPGLLDFSYPLKTLTDALTVNCHLDIYFHSLWKKELKERVSIVVGGAGATGCEFSAELPGAIKRICKKYSYPRNCVSITLIEGGDHLAGQNFKVSEIVKHRLQSLGIKLLMKTFIKRAEVNKIFVQSATAPADAVFQQIPSDILIWTGGVMPNQLSKEALPINKYLQSERYPFIFLAGDNTDSGLPMLAQTAIQEADIAAHNLAAFAEGSQNLKPFKPELKGVVIPLGGKYAILKTGPRVIKGFSVWLLRRLIDLRYSLSILPFFYALKRWVKATDMFVRNE